MEKRYIVCVNNTNEEGDKEFIKYIKANNFGWWHYLKNTWLLTDVSGNSDISHIRDSVKSCYNNEYNVVFQLSGNEGTWSGYGPNSENVNMFKWIKENWK